MQGSLRHLFFSSPDLRPRRGAALQTRAVLESLENRLLLSAVTTTSTTESGWNDHYNAALQDPSLHAAYTLRDPAQYLNYASSSPVGKITYDSSLDAARITLPAGSGEGTSELGVKDVLRLPFAELRKGAAQEVSFQWEARWSSAFLEAPDAGLMAHKAFRLDHETAEGGDTRRFELQTRFGGGEEGSVARPTLRTYFASVIGGDGSNDPLSSGGRTDYQPGGQGEPFDIQPDTWVRFTLSITWHDGQQRLRLWMADEQHDPVLVIADPADPSRGFLVDNTNPDVGLDHFLVLFDTSQQPAQHPELHAWVRNVLVFKDATVPLGGRPGKGSKSAP